MDNKYLVDGANFVISKMHFNAENNYYITLGLPKNATPDEIRERWKRLMLLYHPDKQLGEEDWVSERAKKVNEAYSTLKDEEKRASYDLKLIERSLHQHSVIQSNIKTESRPPRHHRLKASSNPEWDRIKKYIPRILIVLYVLAAFVFLGYIYIQNNSELIENALLTNSGQSQQIQEITVSPVAAPTISELPETAAIKQNKPNKISSREKPAQNKTMSLMTGPASKTLPDVPVGNPASRSLPPAHPFENSQTDEQASQKPEAVVTVSQVKAEPSKTMQNQGPAEITAEEVEAFMELYSRIYARNDINAFMSLFSKSAVENNRLHYNEIREAYQETFSEKISYYRIHNMTTAINGQTATVSGSYDLSRYLSAANKWMHYSGKIQWRVTRENNMLKILNVNYD